MPIHHRDAGFAEMQTNPQQQAQSAKKHRFPKFRMEDYTKTTRSPPNSAGCKAKQIDQEAAP